MKVTGLLIFAIIGTTSGNPGSHGVGHHHDTVVSTTPGTESFTYRVFFLTALNLDGHIYIFRNGVMKMQGFPPQIGDYTPRILISGIMTTETGHRVSVDGGLLYGHVLHSRNTEAIRSAMSRVNMTLEQFIQQTGLSSHIRVINTFGEMSINGIYSNVNAGVVFILMSDQIEPGTESQVPIKSPGTTLTWTFTFVAAKLDGYAYTFRNGDLLLQGSPIEIGENGVLSVISGFLTTETGHRISVDGGLLHVRSLHPRNTEAMRSALSQAGMTLEHLVQQTGTSSPPQIFIEVTAGVISISGTYRNINAAVLFIFSSNVKEPGTEDQTVVVTETTAPETLTVSRSVTLTKTSTHDEYVTITSPVYNSAVATHTNFVRRTVTVPEEQVIRSPVAGKVVVNTIPVSSQLVMTITDTTTNYFVSTAIKTVTSTLQHFTSNFSFRTITINNIIMSTVVHTITRTSIATAYVTNTVGSTVYSTTATHVTISHGPATTETAIPVYY